MDHDEVEDTIEPVYLDLEDRELYLVKLPKELGSSWKNITESEILLGTLRMNKRDALGRRKGVLTVNSDTLSEEIPTEYRTELTRSDLGLKVFSQDGSGRMAIEGKVTESCSMMPKPGERYKKQLGVRYVKSMQKGTVVPLESTPKQVKGGITIKIPKHKESEDEEEEEGKIKGPSEPFKKIKMDREALKNQIFHYFEQREYWPLKELNAHCRQPEAYLKEILKEICVYHKKGPNKSCYELQPHFKEQKP
ncbi:hypothetical protein SDRG_03488 [Saprolegnia diclina VS20]|uniref:Uncharacterized protein n=2 Tax=Saprolegnia TaxID=4769 RepID=A0A067DA92_SAPPC|nr:hypothetical protein SDRG_03488 [Saprolegnia diclina VS20]XP_012193890.1 hypothetical protein SPRG_00401 [Saprolegnia parasitica CBS 223.65]EQC39285.1 hypothetical protein SDRG_03488 [Saprolegnia diclina VS20]KDO35556.1 hypothetical protein SPRG_00401 [Saprolegnia parasitica CBS 223.65]|eukprot:XP_008607346.1 hypothetical protein SDRG_03488 [Saprolegnia diclina VS20]